MERNINHPLLGVFRQLGVFVVWDHKWAKIKTKKNDSNFLEKFMGVRRHFTHKNKKKTLKWFPHTPSLNTKEKQKDISFISFKHNISHLVLKD